MISIIRLESNQGFPFCLFVLVQDNSDDDDTPPGGETGLRGVPWKNFSRTAFSVGRADSTNNTMLEGGVRKSNRVPKRRRLDDGVDDDDDDDEIRYLEKLKSSKVTGSYSAQYGEDEGGGGKQRNISRVMKRNFEGKMSRSGRVYEDTDYVEELVADSEQTNNNKRKKQGMGNVIASGDNVKKEMAVTTRQRALQTGKDASSTFAASIIEFPNGLPPAPPRSEHFIGLSYVILISHCLYFFTSCILQAFKWGSPHLDRLQWFRDILSSFETA